MKKIYLAVLLLHSYCVVSAMDIHYPLPSAEILKDRMYCALIRHYDQATANLFCKATTIHKLADTSITPLSATIYANRLTSEYSLNITSKKFDNKKLSQIILYQLLQHHPRAIEALQNNYGFIPKNILV
jgi:hypothetical protein